MALVFLSKKKKVESSKSRRYFAKKHKIQRFNPKVYSSATRLIIKKKERKKRKGERTLTSHTRSGRAIGLKADQMMGRQLCLRIEVGVRVPTRSLVDAEHR